MTAAIEVLHPEATELTVFRIVDDEGVVYTRMDFRDGRDAVEAALRRGLECGLIAPFPDLTTPVTSYAVLDVVGPESDGWSIVQDFNIPTLDAFEHWCNLFGFEEESRGG